MARAMEVRVVTPARVVFEGTARSLAAPAWDGRVGVLAGHAPLLTLLGSGALDLATGSGDASGAAGERLSFEISGGVMKVESNRVDILADSVGSD